MVRTDQVMNCISCIFQSDSRNRAFFSPHEIDSVSHTENAVWNVFPVAWLQGFVSAPQSVKHSTPLWYATTSKDTRVSCALCRPFAAVSPGDGCDGADWHRPLRDLLPGQRLGHRQGDWCVPLQSRYGHPQPAPQARVLLLCLPNVPRAWRRLQRQLRWVKHKLRGSLIFQRKSLITSMWMDIFWIIENWKVQRKTQSFAQTS